MAYGSGPNNAAQTEDISSGFGVDLSRTEVKPLDREIKAWLLRERNKDEITLSLSEKIILLLRSRAKYDENLLVAGINESEKITTAENPTLAADRPEEESPLNLWEALFVAGSPELMEARAHMEARAKEAEDHEPSEIEKEGEKAQKILNKLCLNQAEKADQDAKSLPQKNIEEASRVIAEIKEKERLRIEAKEQAIKDKKELELRERKERILRIRDIMAKRRLLLYLFKQQEIKLREIEEARIIALEGTKQRLLALKESLKTRTRPTPLAPTDSTSLSEVNTGIAQIEEIESSPVGAIEEDEDKYLPDLKAPYEPSSESEKGLGKMGGHFQAFVLRENLEAISAERNNRPTPRPRDVATSYTAQPLNVIREEQSDDMALDPNESGIHIAMDTEEKSVKRNGAFDSSIEPDDRSIDQRDRNFYPKDKILALIPKKEGGEAGGIVIKEYIGGSKDWVYVQRLRGGKVGPEQLQLSKLAQEYDIARTGIAVNGADTKEARRALLRYFGGQAGRVRTLIRSLTSGKREGEVDLSVDDAMEKPFNPNQGDLHKYLQAIGIPINGSAPKSQPNPGISYFKPIDAELWSSGQDQTTEAIPKIEEIELGSMADPSAENEL